MLEYKKYLLINDTTNTATKKDYIKVELTTINNSINYLYGGYNSKGIYITTRIVTKEDYMGYSSESFNLVDSGYKYKLIDIKKISKNMYKNAINYVGISNIIDILKNIINTLQKENKLLIDINTYNQFISDFTSLLTSILED